jgi:hypothetical protein
MSAEHVSVIMGLHRAEFQKGLAGAKRDIAGLGASMEQSMAASTAVSGRSLVKGIKLLKRDMSMIGAMLGAELGGQLGSSAGKSVSMGLAGAMTGLFIGGPLGAIIGGIAGSLVGLVATYREHASAIKDLREQMNLTKLEAEGLLRAFGKDKAGLAEGTKLLEQYLALVAKLRMGDKEAGQTAGWFRPLASETDAEAVRRLAKEVDGLGESVAKYRRVLRLPGGEGGLAKMLAVETGTKAAAILPQTAMFLAITEPGAALPDTAEIKSTLLAQQKAADKGAAADRASVAAKDTLLDKARKLNAVEDHRIKTAKETAEAYADAGREYERSRVALMADEEAIVDAAARLNELETECGRLKEGTEEHAKKILEIEKASGDVVAGTLKVEKERAALAKQLTVATEHQIIARKALRVAQGDRTASSLQEIVMMQPATRFGWWQQHAAQQVMGDEERAKYARVQGRDDLANRFQGRADWFRGRMTGLSAADRDPMGALRETAEKTTIAVEALAAQAAGEGMLVRAKMGN